jgi:hypothetical protein
MGLDQEHSALLDALPHAALLTDREGLLRQLNRSAALLLGEDTDLRGARLAETLFDDVGRGAFDDVLGVVLGGGSWDGELALTPRRGVPRQASLSVRPVVVDEAVTGALVVVVDTAVGSPGAGPLSERLTRLARVASELVVAESMDSVTKIVVEHMSDAAGATVASLSLLVDPDTLALVGIRGGRHGVEKRWATYSLHQRTPAGDAVRQGRILLLEGTNELRRSYPDLESAADGDRSIACLPLRIGEQTLGVATMSFPGRRSFSPTELEFLSVMADTCAQAIQRVRMTEEAADQSAKIQFLADSSVELSRIHDNE